MSLVPNADTGLRWPLPACGRCGHPPGWHRLDDSLDPTDSVRPFRCIGYDCTLDPLNRPPNRRSAERDCDCPDYVLPQQEAADDA